MSSQRSRKFGELKTSLSALMTEEQKERLVEIALEVQRKSEYRKAEIARKKQRIAERKRKLELLGGVR